MPSRLAFMSRLIYTTPTRQRTGSVSSQQSVFTGDRPVVRRCSPMRYPKDPPQLHSGLVSVTGTPLTGGKARSSYAPVDHNVITPTPVRRGESVPLLAVTPFGCPVALSRVGSPKQPESSARREEAKRFLPGPSDHINIFHSTPITIGPKRPTMQPQPSDIPGLKDDGRQSTPSRFAKRPMAGPEPFVAPTFEEVYKRPYSPSRRRVDSALPDNDIFLRRSSPARVVGSLDSPRRGVRAVSPAQSRSYNIISCQPL